MSDDAPHPHPSDATLRAGGELAGLDFQPKEIDQMRDRVAGFLEGYQAVRAFDLPNDLPPALAFDPSRTARAALVGTELDLPLASDVERPSDLDELAWWPVTQLAALLRRGGVTSRELTELAIGRLKRFDPQLSCVVTLTEERALEQADRADAEIAEGRFRSPLHGIPWGAKDLLAVPGYPTTWGAAPYREQRLDQTATVVERLDAAGAVLVAKLSLGALAMGDWWFGGQTKNPWNLEQGSSGSSAGSAAAVAAGLVGFAIGSETMGSIVSPAARCAVVGLRPTFGRVSRHGAMALSWSMDKLGPMARSVDDCAAVLHAIHGPDGRDRSVANAGFGFDAEAGLDGLRIGYVAKGFEGDHPSADHDHRALELLRDQGARPVPIELPDMPGSSFMAILLAEAAAAFDDLTRSDRDDELTRQTDDSWPNLLRAARLVPAVEYIQANRLRERALHELNALFEHVDVYLCPSTHPANLYLTNVTGHPTIAVPHAVDADGLPMDATMTFTAGLFREDHALTVARAFERARPPLGRPAIAG